MDVREWNATDSAGEQLRLLVASAAAPGCLVVTFGPAAAGEPLPWAELEPWTRSRAVTVADVAGPLLSPALEVALCSDLVYLRPGALLELPGPGEVPPAGVLWSLGRAGRAALARSLLHPGPIAPGDAVALGLAQAVVASGAPLPLPAVASRAALTTARDLMRARCGEAGALALELASFRLLFAAGDPEEGARAFLEGREPRF